MNKLLGIFLCLIGTVMFCFALTFILTDNLGLSWGVFAILYIPTVIFINSKFVYKKFHIAESETFGSNLAYIILGLGIFILSILLKNVDPKFYVLGVLIIVGVHFIPFKQKWSYLLAALTITNAFIGILIPINNFLPFIFIDGTIKILIGILVYNKASFINKITV